MFYKSSTSSFHVSRWKKIFHKETSHAYVHTGYCKFFYFTPRQYILRWIAENNYKYLCYKIMMKLWLNSFFLFDSKKKFAVICFGTRWYYGYLYLIMEICDENWVSGLLIFIWLVDLWDMGYLIYGGINFYTFRFSYF